MSLLAEIEQQEWKGLDAYLDRRKQVKRYFANLKSEPEPEPEPEPPIEAEYKNPPITISPNDVYVEPTHIIIPKDPNSMAQIMLRVCNKHGLHTDEIKQQARAQKIVTVRNEFFYEAYNTRRYSLNQIGHFCGGRDHTTVLHGIRKHCKTHGLEYPNEHNQAQAEQQFHNNSEPHF